LDPSWIAKISVTYSFEELQVLLYVMWNFFRYSRIVMISFLYTLRYFCSFCVYVRFRVYDVDTNLKDVGTKVIRWMIWNLFDGITILHACWKLCMSFHWLTSEINLSSNRIIFILWKY
jgi:hypothetical protein